MTQKQQIANYLAKGKSLTPLQAYEKFGSLRLAAVVYDLKNDGMKIKTDLITVKKGTQVAKYSVK